MACFPLSHRKAGRVVALFCCVLLLFGGCASTEPYSDASSLSQKVVINEYPSHTLQELTQTADAIVYGEVTGILPCEDAGSLLYTPVEISVLKRLKGDPQENPVLYRQQGGIRNGVQMTVQPSIDLQQGQRVILFLDKNRYDLGPDSVLTEHDGTVAYREKNSGDPVEYSTNDFLRKCEPLI